MTYPCIDEDYFDPNDGAPTPLAHTQWRHVATNSAAGAVNDYDYNAGDQSADLTEWQVSWTNDSPVSMVVYALLTRGGTRVVTQSRNRVYIDTYSGFASGASPADPTASTLFGRIGVGANQGVNTATDPDTVSFGIYETRAGERSLLFGSAVTLTPGQTYKARARLRFTAAFWESLSLANEAEAEMSIVSGASRLDLYAYPVL